MSGRNELPIEIDPADFGCETARVVAICVEPGQKAPRGATLIEFECDKASFEVTMPVDGTIANISLVAGERVSSKTLVATVLPIGRIESEAVAKPHERLEELKAIYPIPESILTTRAATSFLDLNTVVTQGSICDASDFALIYRESGSNSVETMAQATALVSDIDWFEQAIKSPRKQFFKCVLDLESQARTIGFCNIETINRTPDVSYQFVGLYVAAPNLLWTCGSKLVLHAIAHCKNVQIPCLLAFTQSSNVAAIRLLEHLDFERFGEFDDPNYDNKDSLCFKKNIS